MKRSQIQVSDLEIGMTVEYHGVIYTVGKESITRNEHGTAFKGDASIKTITRIQFIVPTLNGLSLR